MIEPQGQGLRRWRAISQVRVVVWLRQRHAPIEWPLLQRVSDALVRAGQSVTVVDGLSPEQDGQPGLAHWVAYGERPPSQHPSHSADHWRAGGLQRLRSYFGLKALVTRQHRGEGSAARALAQALRDTPVLIVVAQPDLGLPLLADSAVLPVVAVRGHADQAVYAYEVLKTIRMSTHTDALVVCPRTPPGVPSLARALQSCASSFLRRPVHTLELPLDRHGQWEAAAGPQLAASLLAKSRTIKPWRSAGMLTDEDQTSAAAWSAPIARPPGATLDVHRQGPT
jgi:hypothetical protein